LKLSVVMPVYNEEATLAEIVARVQKTPFEKEILLVNDGSKDRSAEIMGGLAAQYENVRCFHHAENSGKGAALSTGFQQVTGDIVLVQDADLEYDPADYGVLLRPILEGKADVVFGSRFLGGPYARVHMYWHYVGNRTLTTISNMFTNLNLTDMETCYKVFRREVIQSITIEEDRFGFEPEVTAKVAQAHWRVYELGISYNGRTYDEGKKIGWRDGVRAVECILKYSRTGVRVRRLLGEQPAGSAPPASSSSPASSSPASSAPAPSSSGAAAGSEPADGEPVGPEGVSTAERTVSNNGVHGDGSERSAV